ncbi:hypothetical protein AYO38_02190 [bacterium SCGC AG-212-C10]|nr:hypothetical protein AYO38_02190 [bacterium SCGC AG-212-C10]
MRYPIVIEKGPTNYGADSPDVPGCIAVGDTVEETIREITSAITAHFSIMAEFGDPIPEPVSLVDYVDVELTVPVPAT